MNVKVEELMTKSVITAEPHQSVEHVRHMLEKQFNQRGARCG